MEGGEEGIVLPRAGPKPGVAGTFRPPRLLASGRGRLPKPACFLSLSVGRSSCGLEPARRTAHRKGLWFGCPQWPPAGPRPEPVAAAPTGYSPRFPLGGGGRLFSRISRTAVSVLTLSR